jgi:hypothetical protein
MHHREVHRAGDERAWWKAAGIDPMKVARKFWKETRVNEGRIKPNEMPQGAAADLASQSHGGDNRMPTAPAAPHEP